MINQTILKEEFNIRYSMAGYEFDLREKIWNLKRGVIINLSFLDDFLEKFIMKVSFILFLILHRYTNQSQ